MAPLPLRVVKAVGAAHQHVAAGRIVVEAAHRILPDRGAPLLRAVGFSEGDVALVAAGEDAVEAGAPPPARPGRSAASSRPVPPAWWP